VQNLSGVPKATEQRLLAGVADVFQEPTRQQKLELTPELPSAGKDSHVMESQRTSEERWSPVPNLIRR